MHDCRSGGRTDILVVVKNKILVYVFLLIIVLISTEHSLELTTERNGAYDRHWLSVAGKDSIVFRVKVCEGAKVLLVANPDNTIIGTEVAIGLNGQYV